MTRNWGECYQRLASLPGETGQLETWVSPALADPSWDDFLRHTRCGQFQQSSLWAQYKAGEGWNQHRVILTGAGGIVGGFQLLWKKTGLGRIGYVSKGPVAHPETSSSLDLLETRLVGAAKELGLTAVIIQRPDESLHVSGTGDESGFVRSNPMGIIVSTCLVDVRQELEILRGKMRASLRRNIRKARQQPMVVREGTEADLPRFFELMTATCRRQHTSPNPSTLDAIRLLWRTFAPTKSIRLTFAECNNGSPAAQLCLNFGDRVTLWKKGWDGSHGSWHPNELLEVEVLEWAHSQGYRIGDFCSLSLPTARQMLQGQPLTEIPLTSRDEFTLRFGGYPKLLPEPRLLVPNPVLRWGYCNTYARFVEFRSRRDAVSTRNPQDKA